MKTKVMIAYVMSPDPTEPTVYGAASTQRLVFWELKVRHGLVDGASQLTLMMTPLESLMPSVQITRATVIMLSS